ncbi:HAD family hydrolase [Isosphaeraceae bacterium EP7]
MSVKAILFDFDGTLADTANIHVAAWERTFAEIGFVIPQDVCLRAVEEDDRRFLVDVFASKDVLDGDVEGWLRRKQDVTATMLADAPQIYPGVIELITRLRDHYRLAVVTTTWRENVVATLEAAGIADAFEVVVAKQDVASQKPDAEAYTLALSRLGVDASSAWAVEDSPSGVRAAIAAGLRVVAVGHRSPRGDWSVDATYLESLVNELDFLEVVRAEPS